MSEERGQPLRGSEKVLRLAEGFERELTTGYAEFADLKVIVERYVSPEVSDWFWSFTFEHADDYVQALWNGESEFVVFEDEDDYFEDVTRFEDVPRRVAAALRKQ